MRTILVISMFLSLTSVLAAEAVARSNGGGCPPPPINQTATIAL